MMAIAWMSEKKDQRVLCKACMQRCVLKEGEYGKCGVRLIIGGELYLTVYGSISRNNRSGNWKALRERD